MVDITEGRVSIGAVATNYDHTVNADIARRLTEEFAYAQYSGWNFCGDVIYENGHYRCQVWRCHTIIDDVSAETVEELMVIISEKYGDG